MTEPKPFHKCTESCPLFGVDTVGTVTLGKERYGCYVGDTLQFNVEHGQKCPRSMTLKEKRKFMKWQRELERERDKLTTKIYHLQLLIDNCGSE